MRAVEDKVTERESELIFKQSNVLSECSGRLETVQQKWSENSIRDSVCDPLKDGPFQEQPCWSFSETARALAPS